MMSDTELENHDQSEEPAENQGEKMEGTKDESKNSPQPGGKGNPPEPVTKVENQQEEKDRLDAALALASIFTSANDEPSDDNKTESKECDSAKNSSDQTVSLAQDQVPTVSLASSSSGNSPDVNSSDMLIPTPVFAMAKSHSSPAYAQVKKSTTDPATPSLTSNVKNKKPKEKTPRARKKMRYGLPDTITIPKGMIPGQQIKVSQTASLPSTTVIVSTVAHTSTAANTRNVQPVYTSNSTQNLILQKMMQAPSFAAHMKSIYSNQRE